MAEKEVRLVDANAAIEEIKMVAQDMGERANAETRRLLERYILSLPTIDPETLRPKGKWIHTEVEDYDWGGTFHSWTCSHCGFVENHNPSGTKYCPKCGAKMEV